MYLYDPILRIHINTSPLLVSSRVLEAARNIDQDLRLEWDDHGFICGVSHTVARKLTAELGMRMLSVEEFMQAARRHSELQSDEFSEWLSDTYVWAGDTTSLESGEAIVLERDPLSSCLVSSNAAIKVPISRPGWFDLDEIGEDGLPTKLSSTNQPGLWKFWSPGETSHVFGAMRSFVTSSGTCSLDLGIPIFAKHPKIMIRECYEKLETPVPSPLLTIWPEYERLTHSKDCARLRKFLSELDVAKLSIQEQQDEFLYHREKERLIDLLGKKRLLAGDKTDLKIIDEGNLLDTLRTAPDEQTWFVMGHARPDADSVVSSIFEAVRRCLVYPDHASVPWSESIPREVEYILGPEAAKLMSNIPTPDRHNSIVLVDCYEIDPKFRMGVRAVIDHHILDGKRFPYYVALSHEVSWSTTIQIYVKILGSGFDLSPEMAKKLLEATRLEAEPSLITRMGETDQIAMARLEAIAGNGRAATYGELMEVMLNSADIEELFYRDYRQTSDGFSVVKSRISHDFRSIAELNNTKHHLPLTVVKEVIYTEDFAGVCSEAILLLANPAFHDKGFRSALQYVVVAACRQFHGEAAVILNGAQISLKGLNFQTPRLVLMPLIETIVNEHMRFRYASSINRYISLGFYSGTDELYGTPGSEERGKTGLSFIDVKSLLKNNEHTSFLTLPQYWMVYHEMTAKGEVSAVKSLQNDRYVELLDTFISNGKIITHGNNTPKETSIEAAHPSLIRASEGDEETGLPNVLHSPDNYGDPTLWRYWSPDLAENVATRGHIFVMNQTSIDLKVRPEERTKQLTFRPVYVDIPELKVEVENDGAEKWVKVKVFPRLFSVIG